MVLHNKTLLRIIRLSSIFYQNFLDQAIKLPDSENITFIIYQEVYCGVT